MTLFIVLPLLFLQTVDTVIGIMLAWIAQDLCSAGLLSVGPLTAGMADLAPAVAAFAGGAVPVAPLAGAESAALAPSMAVANGPAAAVAAVAAGARGTRLAGTAYREIDVLPGGMATVVTMSLTGCECRCCRRPGRREQSR